ncbi:hypothetical protein Btru_068220 [Bulinus truncatus]|nr:hypothetical protein Btru_068220 [Bulinus truncatus]
MKQKSTCPHLCSFFESKKICVNQGPRQLASSIVHEKYSIRPFACGDDLNFLSYLNFLSGLNFLSPLNVLSGLNLHPNVAEFVEYCVWDVLLTIAAGVAACQAFNSAAIVAATVFTFVAVCVFGVDTYFMYRAWQDNKAELVGSHHETTVTLVTTVTPCPPFEQGAMGPTVQWAKGYQYTEHRGYQYTEHRGYQYTEHRGYQYTEHRGYQYTEHRGYQYTEHRGYQYTEHRGYQYTEHRGYQYTEHRGYQYTEHISEYRG